MRPFNYLIHLNAVFAIQLAVRVAFAQEFYVAKNGDDLNPGSEGLPWLTIQRACDGAAPGSTVYVKEGIYNEQIELNVSGSESEGYVTFRHFASNVVVIDGSGFGESGEQEALVTIDSRSYVRIQGFEIRNLSSDIPDATMIGIYVTGGGDHIEIAVNFIHDIASTAVVNAQRSGRDAHGIIIEGTNGSISLSDIVIISNEIANCTLGSSEALVLNGNVERFEVVDNFVHDNDNIGIDIIGFEGTAPANDRVRDGLVGKNLVSNNSVANNPSYPADDYSAGGIYVDGGHGIVIERNHIFGNDLGVEVASESPGGTTEYVIVRNNLIYRSLRSGISFGGFDIDRGITLNCSFLNNTLFENDVLLSDSGEISINKANDNICRNNIVIANAQNLFLLSSFNESYSFDNSFDYNLYFGPGGSQGAIFEWQGTLLDGFSDYAIATGQDAHSLFEDARFVDSATFDFHLEPISPAIDSGDPFFVPALGELDIDGLPRIQAGRVDIGASERAAAASIRGRHWTSYR